MCTDLARARVGARAAPDPEHAVAVAARPCLPLLPDDCDGVCGFRGTAFQVVAASAYRGGRFVPQMPEGMPSSSSELSACLPPCARTLAERPQAQKQGSLIAVQFPNLSEGRSSFWSKLLHQTFHKNAFHYHFALCTQTALCSMSNRVSTCHPLWCGPL